MRSDAFTFVAVILCSLTWAAGQSETVTEVDPGLAVNVDLNRRVRLEFFTGREKSDDLESAKRKVSVGASFRAKYVMPSLLDALDSDKQHRFIVGTTYEYSRASEAGVQSIEHKVMVDGTGRHSFPASFLLANRFRMEFRWVNSDYRFRLRNRLMLERTIRLTKYKFTPYAAAEAFWDKDNGKWNQVRLTGGINFPLFRRTSIDLFFERANCTTCGVRYTNVFGTTLNIYFKRK